MERIQSFFSDLLAKPVPKEIDLERELVNSEKAIPHASVQKYADFISEEIEKQKVDSDYENRAKIVVDALRDAEIIKIFGHVSNPDGNFVLDEKDKVEVLVVINRIREALLDELRKRVGTDFYLYVLDYERRIGQAGKKDRIIGELKHVQTKKKYVYKHKKGWSEEFDRNFNLALKKFTILPPHPNIRDFIAHDSERSSSILEHRNFITLEEYLNSEKLTKERVLVFLKAVKDCLKAAIFLSSNGLVLQDISLSNIGLEFDENRKFKNGLLFDLEGLLIKGASVSARIGPGKESDYIFALLDFTDEYKGRVSPFEMVYQLGDVLHDVLQKIAWQQPEIIIGYTRNFIKRLFSPYDYQQLYSDLKFLHKQMTAKLGVDVKGRHRRIDLNDALKELNKIIEKLEKADV